MSRLITLLGFPGARTKSASPDVQNLPRADGSGDFIEFVPLINDSATITVFVCHGRLRSLDKRSVDQWRELAEQEKVNIVLHNYPGYGNVAGPRTPKRIKDDCLELLEHVRGCEWAKGTELVLLGNSIGCGPTMWLATQKHLNVKKVVLVSPYTSLWALSFYWIFCIVFNSVGLVWCANKFARVIGRPGMLSFIQNSRFDPFPTLRLAKGLENVDVLVVHGVNDTTIPVSHGKAIAAALKASNNVRSELCIVPGTDHRDTRMRGGEVLWSFLKGDKEGLLEANEKLQRMDAEEQLQNAIGPD